MTVGTRTSRKPDSAPDSKRMDADTKAIIYEGASISQLNVLFGMDNRTISSKISGLEPCGKRAGAPIYSVREAAALLVEPTLDLSQIEVVANYVRKLNPTNMPKMLTKEFWSAMRTKQLYEDDAGDLWRTEKVVDVFSELVKSVRMPLILAKDAIANVKELTDRDQKIIDQIIDGILEELHDAVVKQFGSRATSAEVDDQDF